LPEPYNKKLIEVALPLEAINRESAREKSIRHGHPSTLHLWWARRPLAACRAVLFASIVDDPSSRPEEFPTEEDQERERQRLFRIIEELVKWENTTNETVLEAARGEIRKATDGKPPPLLDPFCGGGSIPLEAQRLGLEAHASDLNPVAVLITKALIEIPPKFAGKPPVNPEAHEKLAHGATWEGAQGLAEDVRYYGKWMRDQAFERIGHLYPKAKLPDGGEATVIAWLWARTVKCPNPACGAATPLLRSFALSKKKGREWHVHPIVDGRSVRFEVRGGKDSTEGTVSRRGARCLFCGTAVPFDHVRAEGRAHRLQVRMTSIITEGERGRMYLTVDGEHERIAAEAKPPEGAPETDLPDQALGFRVQAYGMTKHRDLFTPRQLVALTMFSGLVDQARERILADCGDEACADAIATYLAFAVDRGANYWSSLTPWGGDFIVQTFGRQALAMVWDFAEGNPFSESTGNWGGAIEWIAKCLEVCIPDASFGQAKQLNAQASINGVRDPLICTDPPYYDNIGYADLSDYFYVWLRRSIGSRYNDLFSTLLTPKSQELVATPFRFGGDRDRAEEFFESGLKQAFERMSEAQDSDYPLTLFYAFKQAESTDGAIASTGWDAMLTGLLESGYSVTGTWPVRSERDQGLKTGTNVLASSIVLVCRPRPVDAAIATRRELVGALRAELPTALKQLQHGNIAPVDLAQAAIGPGMAVFSRYAKVLEADGQPMRVRSALALINQTLDEILAEQEGDFDADTRFAVTWFEQRGFEEGPYGEADVLARAKNTSTGGLEEAGILISRAGKVRLLRRDELLADWDPVTDRRPTVWEAAHYLARRLESGGEEAAAELLRRLGGLGETARELAYRLYMTSERRGWAQEAFVYNALVVAWPEIARRVAGTPEAEAQQALEV
jgi:putative DNA methylase